MSWTYDDSADEVGTPEVRLAQVCCSATKRLLGDIVVVEPMAGCCVLMGERVYIRDLFGVVLLARHGVLMWPRAVEGARMQVERPWF